MKILMLNREDALSRPGGDTVQMLCTVKYLQRLGYQVDFHFGPPPFSLDYDLFHIFNLQTIETTLKQVDFIAQRKKRVALSSIWFDFNFDKRNWRHTFKYTQNKIVQLCSKISPGMGWQIYHVGKIFQNLDFSRKAKEVISKVDLILPNSFFELETISRYFKVNCECAVIPNGIDPEEFAEISIPINFPSNLEAFVLEVGTISPGKNQLKLLEAIPPEIPLVFCGPMYLDPNSRYSQSFLAAIQSRANTYYLGELSQAQLAFLYQKAKVHALPSTRETPGLVNLEAAFFGANIATTIIGSAREYFGELAEYCDPYDTESIQKAVLRAYEKPRTEELKKRVMENFTWEIAALRTAEAYQKILKKKK